MRSWRTNWLLLLVATAVLLATAGCGGTLRVKGESMAPTIRDGERVTVNRNAYNSGAPQRGDIVLYEYEGVNRISRVVGLPGEEIGIRDGLVYVNGARLDEPYVAAGTRTTSTAATFQVPDDSYFVMSDNREHSNDSRQIGAIPHASIQGRIAR